MTEPDLEIVAAIVGATLDLSAREVYRPRWNVAPTDQHVVVRGGDGSRILVAASWGVGSRRQINARADATGKRRGERCIVPADGFYEWRTENGQRQPIWFHRSDGGLILFGGLVQRAEDGLRFAIVTTEPNAEVRLVHDRMPLILPPASVDAWLAGVPLDVAAPAPLPDGALTATPVSRRVNNVRNDDPTVLEPDEEPRQGQLF